MKRKMNGERFFELMEHTDDDLLLRAEKYSADAAHLRMHRIIRVTAVAASLCIVIAACIAVPLAMRKGKLPIDDPVISGTTDTEITESQDIENEFAEDTAENTAETAEESDEPGASTSVWHPGVYRESDYPDMPATEGLVYKLANDKKSYYVIGYEGTDTDVYIPATHEGLPVTQIYSWNEGIDDVSFHGAFMGNDNITSVFIGKNVEIIGKYAFNHCVNLEKVIFPDSVREINALFVGCQKLTQIVISDNVEHMYRNSFTDTGYYGNESNWQDGVLYIGNHLYSARDVGETYVVKEGTKSIVQYAFSQQPSNKPNITIKDITFPESLEVIGGAAFFGQSKLDDVKLPSNLKKIEGLAFKGTGYYEDASNWENGILYSGEYVLDAKELKGHITVKEGTRFIADNAFASITSDFGILSITLPASLEVIGDRALNCGKLIEVYNLSPIDIGAMIDDGSIVSNIRNIYTSLDVLTKFVQQGDYMTYCDAEKGIYILVEYMGDDTELVLPSNIDGHDYEILDYAFEQNECITKVTIPKGVTVIGVQAFCKCKNLTDVIIDAACIIKDEAFALSEKLINITLSDDIKYIEMFAFDGTAFYNNYHNDSSHYENRFLYVGNHLITDIGSYAEAIYSVREGTKTISAPMSFYFSTTPTQIVLPEGLVGISANVFSQNDNLKQLIIPDSVEYIGRSAFSSSTIENIRIPDKVRVIEESVFGACKKLEYVIIGSGVEQIKTYAFILDDALTSVYYNGTEDMWNNIDIDDEGNACLFEATVYFYSENPPTTEGDFWHYVDGVPTAW